MKNLVLIFFIFINLSLFAQNNPSIKDIYQELKKQSSIDKSDQTVYNLLTAFYEKSLQADQDEMTSEDIQQIERLVADPSTKNLHILMLFLMYQQHISKTAAVGKKPDSDFQIETMNILESETREIFGKVPAIIYIYKAEALESGNRKEDSQNTIILGLKEYPDSIPLKVYSYLNTKDSTLKNDLIKNHSKHWMVQQFDIK
ncbi:hypothetical protein PFY12_10295 [Chryseobacterium camelliae]|uniref:Uncharacterized protein n=1 Tax=Chryseobacterium camelliae TaxID=1265445 RepID=A0ABY7QIG3_9FLAO|nr:hypothetical protein [Chryseobacterium camelliae]WBV59447.1 hypothetical protein PFY12_10295 [Chryseobacterium camelliae]